MCFRWQHLVIKQELGWLDLEPETRTSFVLAHTCAHSQLILWRLNRHVDMLCCILWEPRLYWSKNHLHLSLCEFVSTSFNSVINDNLNKLVINACISADIIISIKIISIINKYTGLSMRQRQGKIHTCNTENIFHPFIGTASSSENCDPSRRQSYECVATSFCFARSFVSQLQSLYDF